MLAAQSKSHIRHLKKEHDQLQQIMPMASPQMQDEWVELEQTWGQYISTIRSIAHDDLLQHGDKEQQLQELSDELQYSYRVMQRVLH